ncbi:MAG: SxtJ family membrane protein [Verrucomicrobiales bacterium]|nr:SxtJ family membrane protein [Verrucomicrobiales bacterium]
MSTHENLTRDDDAKPPSNRSFGFVFAVVFLLIGFVPLFRRGEIRWLAAIPGMVFLVLGLINSPVLTPLNRLWMRFGLFLHKIVSPIILGLTYFTLIAGTGWILRRLGKDPMRRTFDKAASSYWILRQPPGPPRHSMKNQF